jgi:hypothetical protein
MRRYLKWFFTTWAMPQFLLFMAVDVTVVIYLMGRNFGWWGH